MDMVEPTREVVNSGTIPPRVSTSFHLTKEHLAFLDHYCKDRRTAQYIPVLANPSVPSFVSFGCLVSAIFQKRRRTELRQCFANFTAIETN